jgi:hypothetical protein
MIGCRRDNSSPIVTTTIEDEGTSAPSDSARGGWRSCLALNRGIGRESRRRCLRFSWFLTPPIGKLQRFSAEVKPH